MLFAFVYSLLRLFLDIADVRLRVRDTEAELLLLRHQLRVVRRQVRRPQLDVADRAIMAALSHRVSQAAWVGMLVQPATVLGWYRELVQKVGSLRPPARSRPTGSRSRAAELDPGDGQGQPEMGLCPHSRRTAQARSRDFGNRDSQVVAPELDRSGSIAIAIELEDVLENPGFSDRAHRLPERRHRSIEAPLRPPIYGAGHQEGDLVRGHRSAGRSVGGSAGEEPVLGTRRGRSRRPLPGPRSRRQIRRRLGPCLKAEGIEVITTPIAAPRPTPTSSGRLVRLGASVWTGFSSSTVAISSAFSPSGSSTTTRPVPIGLLGCGPRSRAPILCCQEER